MATMDILAEFKTLIEGLRQNGVDYALCGGLALAIHGVPRGTKDIDILAMPEDLAQVKTVAQRLGFVFEALPMTFSSGITVHRLTKIVDGIPLMLDILEVNKALAPIWSDRVRVSWQGGEVQVVSRDGLISLKTTAGRPQDLVDLQKLWEATRG